MIKRFLRNEAGATAIEYALIGAMIFLAIIAGLEPIGTALSAIFAAVATGLPD